MLNLLILGFVILADGLYVLLRPPKQNKKKPDSAIDIPKAPDHLKHLVIDNVPPETCPWSLSGPQFPQPTAIQQRYCYPKGRPEYSNRKGGALWTMYGTDGKEDVEFRLLHVYFSPKRAVNKGLSSHPDEVPRNYSVSAKKRKITTRTPRRFLPQKTDNEQQQLLHSPAITTSSVTSSSLCSSPLSFDFLPPAASCPDGSTASKSNDSNSSDIYPTWPEQLIVTPINDILHEPPPLHSSRQLDDTGYFSDSTAGGMMFTPSPFRRPIQSPAKRINVARSPLQRTGDYTVMMPHDDTTASLSDPWEMMDLHDSFWNDDPLMNIMLKPSQEAFGQQAEPKDFSSKLDSVSDSIRERILAAPEPDQPKMVSALATWARKMAADPLAGSSSRAGAMKNGKSSSDEKRAEV